MSYSQSRTHTLDIDKQDVALDSVSWHTSPVQNVKPKPGQTNKAELCPVDASRIPSMRLLYNDCVSPYCTCILQYRRRLCGLSCIVSIASSKTSRHPPSFGGQSIHCINNMFVGRGRKVQNIPMLACSRDMPYEQSAFVTSQTH